MFGLKFFSSDVLPDLGDYHSVITALAVLLTLIVVIYDLINSEDDTWIDIIRLFAGILMVLTGYIAGNRMMYKLDNLDSDVDRIADAQGVVLRKSIYAEEEKALKESNENVQANLQSQKIQQRLLG